MIRRALIWLVWRTALMALFLLLAAKWEMPYFAAAALLSFAVASVVVRLMQVGLANPDARFTWLRVILRLPGPMLRDCGVVASALWRRVATGKDPDGGYRRVPFDPGLEHDRDALARRACVTAAVSLAPNTIVVRIDPKQDYLLVHQLVSTPEPPGGGDRKWPV